MVPMTGGSDVDIVMLSARVDTKSSRSVGLISGECLYRHMEAVSAWVCPQVDTTVPTEKLCEPGCSAGFRLLGFEDVDRNSSSDF